MRRGINCRSRSLAFPLADVPLHDCVGLTPVSQEADVGRAGSEKGKDGNNKRPSVPGSILSV